MKITVPMFSRNRPAGLLSVLTTLDALATGSHDITYALIVDDDDKLTLNHLDMWQKDKLLPANTIVHMGRRDKTLNARMNEAMNAHPADYYTFLPDDGFPLTQHWDAMFDGLKELPAFAWCERNDPKNATFIAISERWRSATGRGFIDYFPFWFADTWIMEVHMLAFAKPIGIVQQLSMGGKRGKTQGMRDLPFWFDFYHQTRCEREAEAVKIAKEWGFTLDIAKDRKEQTQLLDDRDKAQLASVAKYEDLYKGDDREPSPCYAAAKERAEAWLRAKRDAA